MSSAVILHGAYELNSESSDLNIDRDMTAQSGQGLPCPLKDHFIRQNLKEQKSR